MAHVLSQACPLRLVHITCKSISFSFHFLDRGGCCFLAKNVYEVYIFLYLLSCLIAESPERSGLGRQEKAIAQGEKNPIAWTLGIAGPRGLLDRDGI